MAKKLIIFILLVIFIIAAANRDSIEKFYFDFFEKLPAVEEVTEKIVEEKPIEKVKKQVYVSLPLRAKEDSPQSFLTVEGVIKFTNLQREKNNLPPLLESSLLNQSALAKAKDMFNRQYFAHESPEGLDAGDLAKEVGYEFVIIGENLALGNFLDDEVLVQSWMDSPGHRENILNDRYQEIGVAVVKDNYQGKSVWMAVQHFGLPLSACPQPNDLLRQRIDEFQNDLSQLKEELKIKKEELRGSRRYANYEEKVEEYNQLVEEYNNLIETLQGLIEQYNNQVIVFNQCVS